VTVAPIEALVLTEASQTSPDHWSITFSSTLDATKYVVKVEAYMSDFEVFDNCRTPDERSPRKQYRLEEWSKQ
jgi:hypothetical protein